MPDPAPGQPQSFEQIIRDMAAKDPSIMAEFGGTEGFERTAAKIGGLDTKFQQTGGVYFALGSSPQETADRFTQIHVDQYRENARPSLPALVAHHLDEIGLPHDSPHYKAAILVAARAEVDLAKTPQYHNKNHYADVTAQVAEFVKKNNELAAKGAAGAHLLTPEEMADSITAAVGHDLDHPGGKNPTADQQRNGEKFDRLRLEEQSFKAMEPLLREAGLPEKSVADIHTMIQTTSPDGPHDILKTIAKAQQEGKPISWEEVDKDGKWPEMKSLAEKLQQDPKLTARAAILEDADLGASAYEGLKSNLKMSQVLTEEVQERGYVNKAGAPENLNGPFARKMFGQFVVKDGPASAAAQNVLGANYADLQATTARELQAMDIRTAIAKAAADDPKIIEEFGGKEKFDATMKKIATVDTEFAQKGGVFYHTESSPQETAAAFTKIHVEQYRETGRPSLPSLVAHHLDEIGLAKDSPHYKAALLVATRAEIDLAKTPEYHNTNHYADVTAQTAEFVKKNNELADKGVKGAHRLTPEEMADSITAAVAHDIDHPGGKNIKPGEELNAGNRLRLEEQSFKAIEPLLKEAGLPEKSVTDIHTMIQTTSPDGPHAILKEVASAQLEGRPLEWEKIQNSDKFPELKGLAEKLYSDPKLTQRAAMLEDADLGASAFQGPKSNEKMSAILTEEVQNRNYTNRAGKPESFEGPFMREMFSQHVVGEGPASVAAQATVGQNYTEMRAETKRILAEQAAAAPVPPAPPAPPSPPAGGNTGSGAPAAETAAPVAPKAPPANNGGAPQHASGDGAHPVAKVAEVAAIAAAAKDIEVKVPTGDKPGAMSKFMGEHQGAPTIATNPKMAGVGGTGAGVLGLALGAQGLKQAIETGDKTEMAIAGTNVATAGAQTAQSVLAAAGKSAPLLEGVGKKLPVIGVGVTLIDGAYQISKEDTNQHKAERAVAVGATATTALVLGTATATAAEAGVITAGVTTVLGTGAAAVGTAAVITAAAPVVLTAAAVGAVAYTGEKAIEAKRAWDDVDKTIAENGRAQKRQNYKADDGKPSVLGYKHIAVAMLHHSDGMKNENMNGTGGLARDAKGRFKIDDFKKIDMHDPKNIAELERVLKAEIQKEDKIIKDNDSFVPKGLRIFSGDAVEKQTMAQMEKADLSGAMQELQMYKNELRAYDAAHPDSPATTGAKTTAPPPNSPQKPRGKGPGM